MRASISCTTYILREYRRPRCARAPQLTNVYALEWSRDRKGRARNPSVRAGTVQQKRC
jgi:hypothetical protein